MNLKSLLCMLILFTIILQPLLPLSIADWVTQSDSSMNSQIIDIIFSDDYETALSIMQALAERPDSYVEDIILAIFSTYTGIEFYKHENLLEVLLSALFDPQQDHSLLKTRYDQNKTALHQLIVNLPNIGSPGFKQQIIRLIPLAGEDSYHTVLAQEAKYIISLLKKNNGYVEKAVDQELIALLQVMSELKKPEFAELCITIACLSSNRDIVKLARKVAAGLLEE